MYVLHYLLDSLVAYRQINPGPHPKLLVLIDEASEYLSMSHERDDLHEPFLCSLSRKARHYSIVMMLASQTTFDVDTVLMANINNKMIFRSEDGPSKRALSIGMCLSPQQVKELGELPERYAVAKIPSYPQPFLLQVPEILVEEVGEQDLAEAIERGKASARGLAWEPPVELDGRDKAQASARDEMDYLEYLATHEPEPVTRTDAKRGIKLSRGSALRSGLVKKGYLKMHRFVIGRGGQVMLPEVTGKGMELLARLKVKAHELNGRGGFAHRLVQYAIWKRCLNSFTGCTAEIEKGIENGYVDVSVRLAPEHGSSRIAYEVFISGEPEKEIGHLKCLEEGYDHMVMVCENVKKLAQLREVVERELGKETDGKVSYDLVQTFLGPVWGMKE